MNKTQQLLKEREEEFMNLDMMCLASIDLTKEEIEAFMSRINSFNITTISILLNSLKEEVKEMKKDTQTIIQRDDLTGSVSSIEIPIENRDYNAAISDISTLLSETLEAIKK